MCIGLSKTQSKHTRCFTVHSEHLFCGGFSFPVVNRIMQWVSRRGGIATCRERAGRAKYPSRTHFHSGHGARVHRSAKDALQIPAPFYGPLGIHVSSAVFPSQRQSAVGAVSLIRQLSRISRLLSETFILESSHRKSSGNRKTAGAYIPSRP